MAPRDTGEPLADRLRVERALRDPHGAAAGADGQLLLGALVRDPRAAEAKQLLALAQHLDLIGLCGGEQLLDHRPTWTSRKRAGTVPWPMCATCSGSPLLHDGRP